MSNRKISIALVSDFFCPNAGGVETHIYFLGKCLMNMGHKVVVITHEYPDRRGVRVLSNGLKVYYLPFFELGRNIVLPTIIGSVPWLRWIFLHEKIEIVHGHATFSPLAHEALLIASLMKLRTVFTDHSLFGFADVSAILTNKLVLEYSLVAVDKVICVSNTSKENTVLRGKFKADTVSTIPNAIEARFFVPDTKLFYDNPTTIVFIGRLMYRKGADLLCQVIPKVCKKSSNVTFIIGGDGEKRVELEEMREKHDLHHRVHLLGMLPHDKVRDVLVQGQIFLNTSLTEAFCMSIVEAASCGLHVVTTKVGGIPEVLPHEYMTMVEPNIEDLARALVQAIEARETGKLISPDVKHQRVLEMYKWTRVAQRTEVVYLDTLKSGSKDASSTILLKRWFKYLNEFGIVYILTGFIAHCFIRVLDFYENSFSKNKH